MVPCYGMEIQPISVLSILYPTTLVNSFLVKFTFGIFFVVKLLSHVQLFVTPWTAACQASLSFTSPRACSNSCLLSRWCHPPISSSVVPFSSCLQSVPASGSFPVSWLFPLGDYSFGSFSFSISPSNEYSGFIFFWIDWFDLLAAQGSLKSLLQQHSLKASIL